MMYIVTYTLNPKRDATKVISELQTMGEWWHYLDETWLLSTFETMDQLWARVAPAFITTDRILIVQFQPLTSYYGWLPKEAWDWIEQHKYR